MLCVSALADPAHGVRATQMTPAATCREHPEVTWTCTSTDDRPTLDLWWKSVGSPVVQPRTAERAAPTRLVVVSWNVHVGGGQLKDLAARLEATHVIDGRTAVVYLLQETFRRGADVPETIPPGLKVPTRIEPTGTRTQVSALAGTMAAFYVPSMRNGPDIDESREDRGNAILSTEPLEDLAAIELPFGRQRRVAVMATVRVAGRPYRFVSLHFDTNRDRARQARDLAKVLEPLAAAGTPLIAAGDFNSLRGRRDGAHEAIAAVLHEEDCGSGWTNVWPHRLDVPFGWWRGRIDYLFTNGAVTGSRSCRTLDDRFGSDHAPLVWERALDQASN